MHKQLVEIFGSHGDIDSKSVDFLAKALDKNNIPGFDYLEFKQSLTALKKMGMDEETSIKSAFATASTVGLTKEKLIKTASHYKDVLQKERNQFDSAMQKQIEKRISGKKGQVEQLKAKKAELQKKIEALNAEIAKAEQIIANSDKDIAKAKEKILSTKNNFETAFHTIMEIIDKDIQSIQNFL